MLESYFSVKKFDADVFLSSGEQAMNFTPDVNTGNFFNRQDRGAARGWMYSKSTTSSRPNSPARIS